jgi:hypothetical protein
LYFEDGKVINIRKHSGYLVTLSYWTLMVLKKAFAFFSFQDSPKA